MASEQGSSNRGSDRGRGGGPRDRSPPRYRDRRSPRGRDRSPPPLRPRARSPLPPPPHDSNRGAPPRAHARARSPPRHSRSRSRSPRLPPPSRGRSRSEALALARQRPPRPDSPLRDTLFPPYRVVRGRPATEKAWVSLVMIGRAYLPGACVIAASLARVGTKYDTVCMVTPDIAEADRDALALAFDVVVEVDYLVGEVRGLRTQKQLARYGPWAHLANTKWRAFGLDCYRKLSFVDADMVALTDMDELLDTLPCPAATFGTPWAHPAARRPPVGASGEVRAMDPYGEWARAVAAGWEPYRAQGDTQLRDPYAGLRHGDAVDTRLIKFGAIDDDCSLLAIASSNIFRPSKRLAEDFIAFVRKSEPLGSSTCNSGIDEQCLVLFYVAQGKQWHVVSPAFNCIPWHPKWVPEVRLFFFSLSFKFLAFFNCIFYLIIIFFFFARAGRVPPRVPLLQQEAVGPLSLRLQRPRALVDSGRYPAQGC